MAKRLGSFRYIKYLKAHRRICYTCEKRERLQKKADRRKYIQENGVSESVQGRLAEKASDLARGQATFEILKKLEPKVVRSYRRARIVNAVYILMPILALPIVPLTLSYFEWRTIGQIALGVAAFLIWSRHYLAKSFAPIDSAIRLRTSDLYLQDLDRLKAERLKHERFYRSTEWRTIRSAVIEKFRHSRIGFVCHLCGGQIEQHELTVDHVKPRSKYPELALTLNNLKLAHRTCNSAKGARTLIQ